MIHEVRFGFCLFSSSPYYQLGRAEVRDGEIVRWAFDREEARKIWPSLPATVSERVARVEVLDSVKDFVENGGRYSVSWNEESGLRKSITTK